MLNISQKGKIGKKCMESQRSFNSINYEVLSNLLINKNWDHITKISNPDEATNHFIRETLEILENASKKEDFRTKKCKKIKPWITQALVTSIKQRDKMKKQLTRNYSIEKEIAYKIYRNKLCKLIHTTKNQHY